MLEPKRSLLQRAIDGDADALSALLQAHGPAVERTLRIDQPWRAHIDSSDVMQVTYVEAFRHIRDFDPDRVDRFEGWLRQMAENNLRDAIRALSRKKRGGARFKDNDELGLLGAATNSTPSRAVRRSDRSRQLQKALTQLPPDYAQVVRMMDFDGRPVGEVASALGRSAGAVHMLRARAHDRLRELLGSASDYLTSA